METRTMDCRQTAVLQIVCDERCPVVRRLANLLKLWDRHHVFTFVDRNSDSSSAKALIAELDSCPSSLLLVDQFQDRWSGPEAVPLILTNLPFGKIAAVLYILPGTMWITKQLYMLVSRHKRQLRVQQPRIS